MAPPIVPKDPVSHPEDPDLVMIPLTRGYLTTIERRDLALVGHLRWHAHISKGKVYAARSIRFGLGGKRQRTEFVHQVVGRAIGIDGAINPDHRNGDGLDNRRSNLRPATKFQNMQNVGVRKDSSTGERGVTYLPGSGRWRAQVTVEKRTLSLGCYGSKEEAARVAQQARRKFFGEFSGESIGARA